MIIIYLLTLLFVYDIPKISPFPVSPRFIFLGLSVLLILQHKRLLSRALAEFPAPFYAYFFFVFVLGAISSHVRNMVAPFEAIVYFSAVVCLMLSNHERAVRFTRYTALLFFISIVWFLCSISIEQPFMAIRQIIYAAHVGDNPAAALQIIKPTGLTFNHFNMGYQISIGITLTVFLWIVEKGTWRKIWAVAAVVMLVGMMFVAQRSTIPAVAIALALSLILGRKWRQLFVLFFISALGAIVMGGMLEHGTTADTLQSRTLTIQDTRDRLGWQLAALKVIAQNPAGNIFGDLDWETESIEEGADYSYYGWSTKAVHNAYLGRMVSYGWLGAVLVVSCLIAAYRSILKPALFGPNKSRFKLYAEASSYAFIAVSIQALFHNASVFTVEPSSWIILSICGGWAAILKSEQLRSERRDNA